MATTSWRRPLLAVPLCLALIAVTAIRGGAAPSRAPVPASAAARSGFCHVTDGTFTACPDGHQEWSDVPAKAFPAEHAFLYADQADLDPARSTPSSPVDTLTLMYDECARTRPLGPDEFFLVSFDTAVTEDGKEKFERYTVHIFGDSTLIFFEDGKLQADPTGKVRTHEIQGQRAAAGFGPSPTCATNHLTVEYQVELDAAGGHGYSDDPLFWGGSAPPPDPEQPPVAVNDEGDIDIAGGQHEVSVNVVANDIDTDTTGVDPSTVHIGRNPQHGSVTVDGGGSVTYRPDQSFKRTDKFTYTVQDTAGLTSNEATVTILRNPCPKDVGASLDDKSAQQAAGQRSTPGSDVDLDGLDHETELAIGTDPCHHDTDGDGLWDSWEVSDDTPGAGIAANLGTERVPPSSVFLPGGFGAPNPLHKDVYVEIDLFDCALGGCPPGDPMVHAIDGQALQDVRSMFAAIPVANPDGSSGVTLHIGTDEALVHDPNCDRPPIGSENHFGTVDQRLDAATMAAKELAFHYMLSGHSTSADDDRPCPEPPLEDIAGGAPLPFYDNTPFGSAETLGRESILSLGPLWICPQDKVAPLGIHPCQNSLLPFHIFPATIEGMPGVKVEKPYALLLGAKQSGGATSNNPPLLEAAGRTQLTGRSIAHLLGHNLGIGFDSDVGNDPTDSFASGPGGYLPPEVYPGAGQLQLDRSLNTVNVVFQTLTATPVTGQPPAGNEATVFSHPLPANAQRRAAAAPTASATDITTLLLSDLDGDGVIERDDNCTGVRNPGQEDLDGDGLGDPCDPDADGDGVADASDPHPGDTDNDGVPNAADPDDDGDGVADTADNCALSANPDQSDRDGDGTGDACDRDADGDGNDVVLERFFGSDPLDRASTPEFLRVGNGCTDGVDDDGDGRTDAADPGCANADGDQFPDQVDLCPAQAGHDDLADTDGDGLGDACDPDADGDGVDNATEKQFGSDPVNPASRPEAAEVPGTCTDGVDNDGDKLTDGADLRCKGATRFGFDANTLPGNDDGSSGQVPLGFGANFFGQTFTSAFVNNNGNLTFDEALSEFTPFDLTTTHRAIVAPFFADVDTSTGNVARYGTGTVDGHRAFGVTWPKVGCFDQVTSVLNDFQVLLIDRGDIGSGDFDIEFNYNQIQWESGQVSGGDDRCQGGSAARVGFSKGTAEPGTFFELPGSGVPGAFLDSNRATGLVHGNRNSAKLGRYVFPVRNGHPVVGQDRDGDGVTDDLDNCPVVANAGQEDANLNGIGNACEQPDLHHTTAAFLQANQDGTTSASPTSTLLGEEPALVDRLGRIVDFRVASGRGSRATVAANLVDSVVALGLLPADQADQVKSTLSQEPTVLTYDGDTTAVRHATATLSATLRDALTAAAVPDAPVSFTLGAQQCTGTTDPTGRARCTVTVDQEPGTATVSASFAGTPALRASTVSAPFTVTSGQKHTALTYTGPVVLANGQSTRLSAKLVVASATGMAPLPDRPVVFTLGGGASAQTCRGITDATGAAACTLRPAQPLGPGTVTASFAGDDTDEPATDARPTTVFEYLAAGTFVVGDLSAVPGAPVMFWGATWSKENRLSGGRAPSNFFGFAGTPSSNPPRCGGTWSNTAGYGGGARPPASVPSYLGVVVSSSVRSSRNQTTGDIVAIVVVKTDAGYAPNPGSPGTGMVVAVVCGCIRSGGHRVA
jgi:hypothetical protein